MPDADKRRQMLLVALGCLVVLECSTLPNASSCWAMRNRIACCLLAALILAAVICWPRDN